MPHGNNLSSSEYSLCVARSSTGDLTLNTTFVRRLSITMRRTPSFHEFMVERLRDPTRPWRLLHNFFVRPLLAGSFVGFWRRWNPPYLYVCLFFVYRRPPDRPGAAALSGSGGRQLVANRGRLRSTQGNLGRGIALTTNMPNEELLLETLADQ